MGTLPSNKTASPSLQNVVILLKISCGSSQKITSHLSATPRFISFNLSFVVIIAKSQTSAIF